jgi:hypothetical protein
MSSSLFVDDKNKSFKAEERPEYKEAAIRNLEQSEATKVTAKASDVHGPEQKLMKPKKMEVDK